MAPGEARRLSDGDRVLVVGLGNPGARYAATRHNAGFQAVAAMVRAVDAHGPVEQCRALVWHGWTDRGTRLVLAQPQTFMNLSGRSVGCLLHRLNGGVDLQQLLVICDDMALPVGRLRLRPGGSAGGHHGLESIIEALGTTAFARLRIGIGEPPPGVDGAAYVLEAPAAPEAALLGEAVRRAGEAALVWADEGTEAAMRRFNAPSGPPSPQAPSR